MRVKQILLAILFSIPSLISFGNEYYSAKAVLNVRSGAGTNYAVSFTLQKGEEVEVLSKNDNGWFRIKYYERTGYAHSKYLKYSRSSSEIESKPDKNAVDFLFIGVCVGLVLFLIFLIIRVIRQRKMLRTVTDFNRGTKTERELVLKLLKFGMPADTIFHDLYMKKPTDNFTQIDLVAVTKVGIIVFEVKNYSGWIFGNGNHSHWTKVLAYGKEKYRFYNPIIQNNKHVIELRNQFVQHGNVHFFSVVVFFRELCA
jgi:hypothetical protein